jgi:Domain of unknown function (DUF4192)
VRASGPADLLALVPRLLGFHPQDSVVVITVGSATHRFHARVDLPTDPVTAEEVTSYLADVAKQNGVQAFAVVVYSDDAPLVGVVVDELSRRLRRMRIDLVCAIRADGRRWWRVGGAGSRTSAGTPYDVGSHPLTAEAVVEGTVVLGSREELANTLVGSDSEDAATVFRHAAEIVERLRLLQAEPVVSLRRHLVEEGGWIQQRVRRFLTDSQRLEAHEVARLCALLSASIDLRDVAWAEMTREEARTHVDLWRDVVRRSPPELRAAPATLLGFAAWLSGNGALAWCAVDCAQKCDPDYSLASLLADALAGAIPPSVWRPFPRESLTLFAP